MKAEIDVNSIILDRKAFNDFVYTKLDDALEQLDKRSKNEELKSLVKNLIPFDIPDYLKDKKIAVLFRQVATPNYEVRRFLSIVDTVKELKPLFWEYHYDKFTSNNSWKYSLGKMSFYSGKGRNGGNKMHYQKILDFIEADGKKIKDIKTLWGQPLIEFHRELFEKSYKSLDDDYFIDVSRWVSSLGGTAKDYYRILLLFFVTNGILFENFMLEEKNESTFTKEVILPAFLEVEKLTGYKPLIVALEPTEAEGDVFWVSHPIESHEHIKNKIDLV